MSQFLFILFIGFCYLLYLGYQKLSSPKTDYAAKLEEANRTMGELRSRKDQVDSSLLALGKEHQALTEAFEKLRFNKISGDVKLGQKTEHLLPFLEAFPYKNDEIKGLFQPIDLIVFRDDEVVFVEVKTGAAQLSEKERRIRDNIKAGRVRFEVHRLNEKGVTIK